MSGTFQCETVIYNNNNIYVVVEILTIIESLSLGQFYTVLGIMIDPRIKLSKLKKAHLKVSCSSNFFN